MQSIQTEENTNLNYLNINTQSLHHKNSEKIQNQLLKSPKKPLQSDKLIKTIMAAGCARGAARLSARARYVTSGRPPPRLPAAIMSRHREVGSPYCLLGFCAITELIPY